MGVSKKNLFTAQQNRLAELAKAIAHPARIAIIQHLITIKACVCGDIVEQVPLSQSTISQHLKALKEAGIIKGNVEGVSVCYCINEEVWEEAKKSLAHLFDKYEGCC